MVYAQTPFDIRCEWGEKGVEQLAPSSDAVIIVDVLSFSTCVAIAVHNGAVVYPFHSKTIAPEVYAESKNALLATKQRQAEGYSLAPSSLINIPAQTRIVLPSPNGSTLSTMTGTRPTFAGCLRNAAAVATAAQSLGKRVSVIPAGERWFSDFTLRPAMEDWIGAGAIIHCLRGTKSIEAQAAETIFLQFRDSLFACFEQIGSGRELIEKGFPEDVRLASELNVSVVAPRLVDSAYQQVR